MINEGWTPPLTSESQIIAELALWFARNDMADYINLPPEIEKALKRHGNSQSAIGVATRLATGANLPAVRGGYAARRTARGAPARRAAYLVSAARRLTRAMEDDTPTQSRGVSRFRLFDKLRDERRYLDQHLQAEKHRMSMARKADMVVRRSGPQLVWKARLDARTTPDCRALHGTVFHVQDPPGGKYPGQVHSSCRCRAVAYRGLKRGEVTPDAST